MTASAPLSAPSAISLLTDYSFSGWPALGATVFTPLLSTSWQKQFGNVYTATGDVYEAQYANGIDTLVLAALMHGRHGMEGRRFVDCAENAMYWRFVWLAWLPLYLLIYWLPRLQGP